MKVTHVVGRLDAALKPLGFARKKYVWNRRAGDVVDVIDIQISKGGDLFTLNAGVTLLSVLETVWGPPTSNVIQEPQCMVRTRIGRLVDGREQWWEVDEDAAVGDEVARSLLERVLPFLERMHSPEAMVTQLVSEGSLKLGYPPPLLYTAILWHRLGQQQEACAILADRKRWGAWAERFWRVARQLRCEWADDR